ncbi:hypothetical protein [Mycobacterium sp. 94-17]|uniref:hypothetical protein n=1 Tax=Mycobacterium sp. 94-17 TaxID=2986147 RepID=UPI002D1F5F05|nr:hypothetical protein [Mycobacterium sp. 94-17]MEB4210050.1 hypothetical protein [Mycobacterium sp. 94-17]
MAGGERLDFVKDLGAVMPLRVGGMLFGIPADYQRRVQEDGEKFVRTTRGGRMTDNTDAKLADGEVFAGFIDWAHRSSRRRPHHRAALGARPPLRRAPSNPAFRCSR